MDKHEEEKRVMPDGIALTTLFDPLSVTPTSDGVPTPVIRIVGVGDTGARLLGLLRNAALPRDVEQIVVNTPQAPVINRIRDADLVLLLVSTIEQDAQRAVKVIATMARLSGALVVGMLTPDVGDHADAGPLLAAYRDSFDSLIVLPSAPHESVIAKLLGAYVVAATEGLACGFQITAPVGADYLDVRATFTGTEKAHIGIGTAQGADRPRHAVAGAIEDLGSTCVQQADGVLVLVAGSRSLRLREIGAVADCIQASVASTCRTCLAVHYDARLGDVLRVTLIVASALADSTGA
ncbi:hypothetical protein [Paraburkholderia sp. SOS3]|uniref:hypothetical protein n=1 Tax=Paraburkholderia sp. SOS3 TaxID=1926494 RepID=UPI0009476889|nr:hypothetical protein [Paraburkholderia sp. SOS3]APR36682.1 hypothetical protein BTO02_16145 [Paraburkholderia sp. SOS3]